MPKKVNTSRDRPESLVIQLNATSEYFLFKIPTE